MIIANGGPSLAQLRRIVGTREVVDFIYGSRTLTVNIEGMVAVGSSDLSISIPRPSMQIGTVWYVTGTIEEPEESSKNFLALISFNSAGKFWCGVIIVDEDEEKPRSAVWQVLDEHFVEAVRDSMAAAAKEHGE